MIIELAHEDIERWRIESQPPQGQLVEVTVSDIEICEGMGCYCGLADIYPHVVCRWENGAKRREPIPLPLSVQRDWLLTHRRELYPDWLSGESWAHGEL
jgi:hypothetical protein